MSEGSGAVWRYVRGKLLPPGVHATRIENEIGAGFPDVHYTYRGISGTLELKFLRKKNLPFGEEGLNKDQRIWIRDEVKAGGIVWLVADVNDHIFVLPGKIAFLFNELDLDAMFGYADMICKKRSGSAHLAGAQRILGELLVKKV